MNIPFVRPSLSSAEMGNIETAMSTPKLCGRGPFTADCEAILKEYHGAKGALLTTSCTDAIELAAMLLGIGSGDEVIVPSFTFVSTANAFCKFGATPVFCDIREDTLNMDEELLESLITPKTRAIVPVHYAGVGCNMERIMEIAEKHGLKVIEDNAHGVFGSYHGKPLGSFGTFSTLSFHETKNFTCGEGGALIINDSDYVEKAEIMLEKGTNRSRFFRGQVDKYTWVDLGSSFILSDLLAAMLKAQLERREEIQGAREKAWFRYQEALEDWAGENGVTLPGVIEGNLPAWHLYYMLFPDREKRDAALEKLKTEGIGVTFHYVPLHDSPMGAQKGRTPNGCELTTSVSGRLLRLPFFTDLTAEDQETVIEKVKAITFS